MTPNLFTDAQLRSKDIETLKRWLRVKLGGYTVATNDMSASNIIFRGVPWTEQPSTISDVSYCPAAKVTKLGRVNRVGQSAFYGSLGGPVVFYELRAKQGDCIALSEWQVTEPLWMHNLGYHYSALQRMGTPIIRQRLTNPIPNETKRNERLREQLSRAFTEDVCEGQEYRYKQSIAINELLFDKAEPIRQFPNGPKSGVVAGTVYPAMQLRGAADNIAIRPDVVDAGGLRLKSVRYVLVEAANEQSASYIFLTMAISRAFSGEEIVWQKSLPSEKQRRSTIALEKDNWVLRDGFGNIYAMQQANRFP